MEFDFGEINLNDDWDAEVPGGIDVDVLVSLTGVEHLTFEQELIVNDDSADHRKVEMVDMDPFEELQRLIDEDNLKIEDEWPKSGVDEKSSPAEESSTSQGSNKVRKQCPICKTGFSAGLNRHVIMHHLPWFAYPKNACWECKKPVAQVGRFQHNQDANSCIGGEF